MEVTTATASFDIFNLLIILVVGAFVVLGIAGAFIYFMPFIAGWYKYRNREKSSLEYVLLQLTVPRANEIKIDAAEQFISSLFSIKAGGGGPFGWFKQFVTQPNISFEIVALPESISFYISCHKKHKDLVEKQINGSYPDASVKEVPEYNIFSETGQVAYSALKLRSDDHFPIKTFKELAVDPLAGITSALGKMQPGEGAVIQMVMAPADNKWKSGGKSFIKKEKDPGTGDKPKSPPDAKQLEAVENKISKSGFHTVIRIVTSAPDKDAAKAHLTNIKTAFEQFNGQFNGFSGMKIKNEKTFIEDFIYRYMPKYDTLSVMTTDELATVFHLPNKSVETPHIKWLPAKSAPAPASIPTEGLYIGKSDFRGQDRPVFISEEDRRRHMYIIGRTGTGKSELLLSLMLQDIMAGKGLCFIDPHGDAAEDLLGLIPPNRIQDVIYWDPSDTERPFGLNMLEYDSEQQKYFVVESIIGLLYKLYDPNKTGIIGPRLEHAARNIMLTIMSVPGGTLIEVVRALQDAEYVKQILPMVHDPLVRRYWTDQIAQTSDFHKSETLDYYLSKFSKFVINAMLRNIVGQSQPSIKLRSIMDEGKILIVNLSKGKLGEENSQFLGLILVPKILAAAMSRADIPIDQRKDFFLYVDEFQNFATETFATILSEARKYRLNLVVANQFIGQMSDEVKNAIFGNVGSILTFRTGVTDANFLQNEFAPIFTEQDIVNIEAHHIYMKTQVNGEPVPPFTVDTTKDIVAWKAMIRKDVSMAIRENSRLTYGRDKHQVEAEIASRSNL